MAWRKSFKRECKVALCSFDDAELSGAVEPLQREFGSEQVVAQTCDVTRYDEVNQLWQAASKQLGPIHIWINNAGITSQTGALWNIEPTEMHAVVNTNLLGTMYGVRVAMHGMLEQGFGDIYNFYGHGSWDERKPTGFCTYGTTKRAIRYYTECLIEETHDLPIRMGWLMPGVVLTDLIFKLLKSMPDAEREMTKKMINVIGEPVEKVAPWLVEADLDQRQTRSPTQFYAARKSRRTQKRSLLSQA